MRTPIEAIADFADAAKTPVLVTSLLLLGAYISSGIIMGGIDKQHAELGNPNITLTDMPVIGPLYAPFEYTPPVQKP